MSKFTIECPECGQYVKAQTGFFARKKIDCSCGHTIHVRTDKYASRECPNCLNMVLVDLSDGKSARCPVCHKPINKAKHNMAVEFSCEQCGVLISAPRHVKTYTCPVCDHENDVTLQIRREEISEEGLASIIKYEGDNETLVWKHPIEDFNLGSQLIVHESQEAIFFRDGQALDLFGAGRYTLENQQLPLLERLFKLPTDTETTFHSEVYYINMATQMGVKWGTDTKVRLFDPGSGMHVELGASGEFNIRVTNSRKLLLKLVGTTGGLTQDQLLGSNGKGLFRSLVMTQVKSYLASVIREKNISVLVIDEHLMELSEELRSRINPMLADYGLEMPEFFVARVVTPDEDPNFHRMKEQYAQQYLDVRQEQIRKNIAEAEAQRKVVEAQTVAQMKIIGAQGEAEALKIKAMAEAEAYRAQAMVEAEEMRAKGYTYQQETSRQVSMQAMQNGLIGNGNAGGNSGIGGSILGGISDIASLGVTLGAMGSVVGMTKDVLNPVMDASSQMGRAIGGTSTDCWECIKCGQKGISTNFCPNCGEKKPIYLAGWTCVECGAQGLATNFCPNCGAKKPAADWHCTKCGQQNITTNFCPNCGNKRGE